MNQKIKYRLPSSPKGKHYSNPLGPSIPLPNSINRYKSNIYNKIDFINQPTNIIPERCSSSIKKRYNFSPLCILRNAENNLNSTDMINIKMGFDLLNHKIERINDLLSNPLTPLNKSYKTKYDSKTYNSSKILDYNYKHSSNVSTIDNNYSNNFINNTQRSYSSNLDLHYLNDYNNDLKRRNLAISTDNFRTINQASSEQNINFTSFRDNDYRNYKIKKLISDKIFNKNDNDNDNSEQLIHVNLKKYDNIKLERPLTSTNRIYTEKNQSDVNNSKRYSYRNIYKNSNRNYLTNNTLLKNNDRYKFFSSYNNYIPNKINENNKFELPLDYHKTKKFSCLNENDMKITVNKINSNNNNIKKEKENNINEGKNYFIGPENDYEYDPFEKKFNNNFLNFKNRPISLKIREINSFSKNNIPFDIGNDIKKDDSLNKDINFSKHEINDNFTNHYKENGNFEINQIGKNYKYNELKKEIKDSISYISNTSINKEIKEMPQDNYEKKINQNNNKTIIKDGEKEKIIQPDYEIIKDGDKEIKKVKINKTLSKKLIRKKISNLKMKNSGIQQKETIDQSNASTQTINNNDNIQNKKEKKNQFSEKQILNYLNIKNTLNSINKSKENELINNNKENELINLNKENELINLNKENELINLNKDNELINKNKENELINKNKENELIPLNKENELINRSKDNDIIISNKENIIFDNNTFENNSEQNKGNIINFNIKNTLREEINSNTNSNNIDNYLLSSENNNDNSEEEERIFQHITQKAKESIENDEMRKHSKFQSDLETPKNEIETTNKLITFSEKHLMKFDAKETLTHLSIFDPNSTPEEQENESDVPSKLTPLVINSSSEKNDSDNNNYNLNSQDNYNNNENIDINNINNINIHINDSNYKRYIHEKQINTNKLSEVFEEVSENESNKKGILIEENENNNETEFNNNQDTDEEREKKKNNNIINNSNNNSLEKQNKNKFHKPIPKSLCPKFINNPQQFFTEELCENVLKSYDIPIGICNTIISNNSNNGNISVKNNDKIKKEKTTTSPSKKIFVTRKLIGKNQYSNSSNKENIISEMNKENIISKFNIYNFSTFGDDKTKFK